MKKNGFTLIELLAVIAILAIIMLIAFPMINQTIQRARRDGARNSVRAYVNEIIRQTDMQELDLIPANTMTWTRVTGTGCTTAGSPCLTGTSHTFLGTKLSTTPPEADVRITRTGASAPFTWGGSIILNNETFTISTVNGQPVVQAN